MYLFDEMFGKLYVYDMKIDKRKLIEYKKKHLEDIKSVVLHINDRKTEDFLFWNDRLFFNEIDKLDEDTNKVINHIELTNNKVVIDKYINGGFDKYSPIYIISDDFRERALKSDLANDNYTLLFNGGVRTTNSFVSNESILLSGYLAYQQQLLYGDINKIGFLDSYLIDEEFINLIKCDLFGTISLYDLKLSQQLGISKLDSMLDEKLEKSYNILKLIK